MRARVPAVHMWHIALKCCCDWDECDEMVAELERSEAAGLL